MKSRRVNRRHFLYLILIIKTGRKLSLVSYGSQVSFKDLGEYSRDFSQIELVVDKELYNEADNAESIGPFVAGCGIFYQMYSTENSYSCTVTIVSEEDKKK